VTKGQSDNSAALRAAAQRRSQLARQRTLEAITWLVAENQVVTPTSVARRAGVSRQWLYTFGEALEAIHDAATTTHRMAPVPREQRASVASLQHRLEVLTEDNQRLRRQVGELEDRLARAYGELRSVRT
jgi:hypothetical protein